MTTQTRTQLGVRHSTMQTPLGEILLVADGDALRGVYFEHHWHRPSFDRFGPRIALRGDAVLAAAAGQIHEFLSGDRQRFDLPTHVDGSSFQRDVWSLIAAIPYGQTRTYGDLAIASGDRQLAREVGNAVGRNPLSLVVPCHRVVGKDGKLTGYAGGLERKQFLLRLEELSAKAAGRLF